MRGACCWWRRRTRWATRHCCGGRPGWLGIPESAERDRRIGRLAGRRSAVVFRHPLVRSAVYLAAGPKERREVHRALAEATDPDVDPDRRAWHRAHAAAIPDEDVAADLELSAARAQARSGFAAAAAFLERAAALTPAPSRRAQRALAAAQMKFQAGALDDALNLLSTAESGVLSALERARVRLLRAQIAFVTRRGNYAAPLLLDAADRLADLDPVLARETYLEALVAAGFAGRLAGAGGSAQEVAIAARAAPSASHTPRGIDVLLDGLATLFSDCYEAAVPILRQTQRGVRYRHARDRRTALGMGGDGGVRASVGRRAMGHAHGAARSPGA